MKTFQVLVAVLLSVSLAHGQTSDAGVSAVDASADGGASVGVDAGQLTSDVPAAEQVVVLDAAQARLVRERILSCEAERDSFRKAPLVSPVAVVVIAAAAAIVSGVVVAGVYEAQKAKP